VDAQCDVGQLADFCQMVELCRHGAWATDYSPQCRFMKEEFEFHRIRFAGDDCLPFEAKLYSSFYLLWAAVSVERTDQARA